MEVDEKARQSLRFHLNLNSPLLVEDPVQLAAGIEILAFRFGAT
jgi:hypothetical protein